MLRARATYVLVAGWTSRREILLPEPMFLNATWGETVTLQAFDLKFQTRQLCSNDVYFTNKGRYTVVR